MINPSIPPSEADGNSPLDHSRYRVHRLYSADDILRDMLGEEPESPPGLVNLALPLGVAPGFPELLPDILKAFGAVPSLPNFIPALSEAIGVVRLPEVQTAIDVAWIAAPTVIDAMLVDWATSFRSLFGALAVPSIAADTFERWGERNPVLGLAIKVLQQAPDWEDSLDMLAQRPEFSPMSAERERNPEVLSRIDAYRDRQISNFRVRAALLGALLNMPRSISIHEFLPYLQKAVQSELSRNQFPLLQGGVLLDGVPKKRGRPVGSTAIPDAEFPAHYEAAYRRVWRDIDRRPTDLEVAGKMGISPATFYRHLERLAVNLPCPSEPAPPEPAPPDPKP